MEEIKKAQGKGLVAVVRVKGEVNLRREVRDTLKMLNLVSKNSCVVLEASPSNTGMIKKVKDYVTWGEIDQETVALLEKRRKKGQKFIRLGPPKKGFGRKGVKVPFNVGGALGYRKDKINDLIKRMV